MWLDSSSAMPVTWARSVVEPTSFMSRTSRVTRAARSGTSTNSKPRVESRRTSPGVHRQTDGRARHGVWPPECGLAMDDGPDQAGAIGDEDLIGGVQRVQSGGPGGDERGYR